MDKEDLETHERQKIRILREAERTDKTIIDACGAPTAKLIHRKLP